MTEEWKLFGELKKFRSFDLSIIFKVKSLVLRRQRCSRFSIYLHKIASYTQQCLFSNLGEHCSRGCSFVAHWSFSEWKNVTCFSLKREWGIYTFIQLFFPMSHKSKEMFSLLIRQKKRNQLQALNQRKCCFAINPSIKIFTYLMSCWTATVMFRKTQLENKFKIS